MSAMAGDLCYTGSVSARLAAIRTVFLIWSIRKQDARICLSSPCRSFLHHRSPNPSSRAATAQQVNDENHERDQQQQMNQTSGYVETDSQKPENQKNCHNPPSQSHCHSLRRNMRAQYLHNTNGFQTDLTRNPSVQPIRRDV